MDGQTHGRTTDRLWYEINIPYLSNEKADIKTISRRRLYRVPTVGENQGNLFFLQGQGKVREFCKMVREIRKSSKVREKSGNFKIMFG